MERRFKKILVANRGEIAIRVIRSCREMGIESVSVHSTADHGSLHVKMADESVCIGPERSSASYLNIPALLSAADITEADAIHPGYGFLSEQAEFAKLCAKWNIVFIGPRPDLLLQMGEKLQAKETALKAGLPVLPSIRIDGPLDNAFFSLVKKMRYPVLIKAASGGGGKGMKRIHSENELIPAIDLMREEARAAFGDGTVFIEKFVSNARHIEVQILADQHGNVVHLGERDCTIQRRFQKLIEESPSPVLTEKQRQDICNSAVQLARHIGYDSAGTVEFLFDQDSGEYYFMEMNPRIQVEHPVSEQRTGIDIVSEQIRIAMGYPLRFRQKDIHFSGHVIECRINAENEKGVPCPGKIDHYHRPGGIGVRVDDFVYTGYRVLPYYDSLISKVIVWAPDRESCIIRMDRALNEMVVTGITTTIPLHRSILNDERFRGNNYATNFLSEMR